jgi:hypothetical protein
MTVKQLKELIARVEDSTPVLIPGSDHSYRPATARLTTATRDDAGWSEAYGDSQTPVIVVG